MGLELVFVLPFNRKVINKPRYESLEALLTLPVQIGEGETIARMTKSASGGAGEEEAVILEIPDGKDIASILSSNVSVSKENKTEIVSDISGYVCAKDEKIVVTKFCEVFGDVGPLTGDIKSLSSISIHGGIESGYKVISGVNIEVVGLVEGSHVQAKGSVVLKGGMAGVNKGTIIAGKDAHIKFAQQCKIESGGSIVVDGPLMDCELNAGGNIVVKGGAALVGGVARCRSEIRVPKIGSEGGTPTEVELGYNPSFAREKGERKERMAKAEKELRAKEIEANFVSKEFRGIVKYNEENPISGVMSLTDLIRDGSESSFDSDKKNNLIRFSSALLSIIYLRNVIDDTGGAEEESSIKKGYSNACLRVDKIAHPGVKISMLGSTMLLDKEYEAVKFVVRNGEIEAVWL